MGDLKEAPSFVSALAVVNKWKIVISVSPNKEIFKKKKDRYDVPIKKVLGTSLNWRHFVFEWKAYQRSVILGFSFVVLN